MIPCLNPVTASLRDPEDYIKLAAKRGFKGADEGAAYWAAWVERTSIEHVKSFCAEQGCIVGHGGLPVNFREDEETLAADLVAFPKQCVVMKELGTRGMATWLSPTVQGDVAEFRATLVKRLKKIVEILKDHGLMLGLEFVGPKTSRKEGTPFIYDMYGMLDLCAEIDACACGLLLDSYHWYTSHGTAEDICTLKPSQVVHVHINDAYPGPIDELMDLKRLLPGEGVIDLKTFLTSLEEIGYNGPVAVETFSEELKKAGPEEAAKRAGDAMHKIMNGRD